jgi:hypothetical protein
LKAEIKQLAPQIVAASLNAGQPGQAEAPTV